MVPTTRGSPAPAAVFGGGAAGVEGEGAGACATVATGARAERSTTSTAVRMSRRIYSASVAVAAHAMAGRTAGQHRAPRVALRLAAHRVHARPDACRFRRHGGHARFAAARRLVRR